MLKPSDTWSWYFDETHQSLMLNLGTDMVFKTNVPRKLLVEYALIDNEFTVDDASLFQTFRESVSSLDLSVPRQAELTLYCVAAARFHKPVQPKSWFFDRQGEGYTPRLGELIQLTNDYDKARFIALETGENASLCICVEPEGMMLTSSKTLEFGQVIKVMHDRVEQAYTDMASPSIALVS